MGAGHVPVVIPVNVLAGDQAAIAARFAGRGADRLAPPTAWQAGADGVPFYHRGRYGAFDPHSG